MTGLPVVDLGAPLAEVAAGIDEACRRYGFFYVVGHGVPDELQRSLEREARAFFLDVPDEEKAEIAMARGGRAWRGWFPVGGELTSGRPDLKEGIYFGTELPAGDPRPLHGPNLFPRRPAGLRDAVLAYLDVMTDLGHRLLEAVAVALGREPDWFRRHLTADPTILFRIFHYPPSPAGDDPDGWGVGEHTDYGLLTLLRQDGTGGLQVRTPEGWIDAPPIEGSFVCNLGDMLQALTDGRYRSTPHRVRNTSGVDRLSFPFFFDPSWDAAIGPAAGTYGDYVVAKVAKVFPELGDDVLPSPS